MEALHHTSGSLVWVWASNEQGWVKGTVQKVEKDGQLLVQLEDGKTGKFKPEDCPLANPLSRMGVEDMTSLSYLNEPGVLWNLKCRYLLDAIYTYTGSILIAVNPFASLPHMYGSHMMEQYRGADLGELSPHVYAIADAAYRQMRKDNKSQSILVSGESGAGKTETSKLIMQHLAWMGNETSGATNESDESGQPSVERKVLESNPLLEAFGNAKTVRNDNSSRFGKFVEIQFNKKGRISGAAVRTYLLERSRVVQLTDPERNYHVFYQICEGATKEERRLWSLRPASEFHYLNQSTCYKLKRVDNAEEYTATRRAMTLVGISLDEQAAIFATVASVLHLGNISFSEGPDESSQLASADAKAHLEATARLLGVPSDGLLKALTTRTRHTFDGPIVSPLDVRAATDNRDSLAKMVYSRMFDWLVQKINAAIGQDQDALAIVGVLDIYGFEQFKENDFEQFCINLANEKLQQHFNQHVFKMEQAEYEREAIDWSYIQFVDNQDVLDLIERKPMGILDILNEQCRFPTATNADFANKLYMTPEVASSGRFAKPKLDQTGFTIQHYAGAVTYKTGNFLAKNKDFVVAEHQQLMQNSSQAFVRALFPPDAEDQQPEKGKGGRAVASGYKFSSVGTRFKAQLADLMTALHTMEPHYIRCIKPNSKNQPMDFENNNVLHQLRCGGVLEAVRISCAGFPTKMPYEDFVDHFWNLVPHLLARSDLDDAAIAKAIVDQAHLEGYQAGKTKIFLRAGQMAELDKLRTEMMNKSALIIQRCMRGYLARSYFKQKKAAVITLQACTRGMLARKLARSVRREKGALRIQTAWRMAHLRHQFQRTRSAVLAIQAAWRGHVARTLALDLRQQQATVLLQAAWRGCRARRRYLAYRRAVVALQCCWRRKTARRELRRRRKEAQEAGKLLQDKQALDAKLKETLAILETVQNQRNDLRQACKEERASRETAEALLAAAQEESERSLAEVRAAMEAQLAAEAAAHATTKDQLAAMKKQVSSLNTAAEAARAQLQAHSISSQQRTAQFERQKADLEAAAAAVKTDLMNRLNNAIKQRDAAREEALLATQKLSQFQEELDSGALTPSPAPSSLHDPGMIDRAQRYMPNAGLAPGHATPDSNGTAYTPRTPTAARRIPAVATPDGDASSESEVDKRQRELYSKQQHLLREQRSADQERLLACISGDLGFHGGRPLAALVIFRSCLQWKTFQADRTQLFDRIINAMGSQIEAQQENNICLSYWLSNTVTLLYLLQKNIKPASGGSYNARLRSPASRSFFGGKAGTFTSFFSRTASSSPSASGAGLEASIHSGGVGGFRQVEAKYPALLFKQQLDAFVQKIFPMLRDNVKKEITPQLAACIHAPRTASTRSRRSHSLSNHAAQPPEAAAPGPPGMGAGAAQLSPHWSNILQVFETLLDTLKRNNVPAFLVRKLFQQLFSFVNVQLFNQLLLRRECCSFSNGEYVKTGLAEVEQWIHTAGSQWVGESWEQLKYIRQAVSFLVIHQKHNKSLEEITSDLCPVLSVQQLYRISTMYWDDRYGTETVSHEVLARMKQLMVENNSAASHSFLLDDDSSIPFSLDDIQNLMDDKEMYSEVPVPKALRESKNFEFLKRDLRRAGSLTDS